MIRKGHLCQSFPTMSRTLNNIVSSLQRSGTFINSLIAASTIGGQQLFSSLTFRCPCQVGKNFSYGSAFLVIPAFLLLVAGYALRSQLWTMTSEHCCSCAPPQRRISPLERKLACLRVFSITGRALVAPLTWLAVTLLTGTYYECAASEFASVDHYPVFDNVSASKRKEILAGFPCGRSAPSDMIRVRDEVALLHRYQSQVSSRLSFFFLAMRSRLNRSHWKHFTFLLLLVLSEYRTQTRCPSSHWATVYIRLGWWASEAGRPVFDSCFAIY